MTEIEKIYRKLKDTQDLLEKNTEILNISGSENSDICLLPDGLHSYLGQMSRILTERTIELGDALQKEIDQNDHPVLLVDYLLEPVSHMIGAPLFITFKIGAPSDIKLVDNYVELKNEIQQVINEQIFPIIEKYKRKEGE